MALGASARGRDVLRINGLVRAFNQVRAQLRDGIPPAEADAFRKRVTRIVGQVEALCRHHGTTPARLPAPSRAAYRFLKELDLASLPLALDGGPIKAESTLRLKNILTVERRLAIKMWARLPGFLESAHAAEQLRSDIEQQASTVEAMCSRSGVNPWALQLPSRRVYCWLKFLADQENLDLHLRAMQRARNAAAAAEQTVGTRFELLLMHIQSLWTKRQDAKLVHVKVSEGFIGAGEDVWSAIIRTSMSGRNGADDQLVREFAQSEDFSEVLVEVDAACELPTDSTRGRVYRLDESFQRVNGTYFGGAMPRPRLEWNRMLTGRKFGHYRPHRDTVMLSVSLDNERVPAHVVDFVMYHELLHKRHGFLLLNGRRLAHTPAFRADERLFAHYEDAQRCLDALAQNGGLPARGPRKSAGARTRTS